MLININDDTYVVIDSFINYASGNSVILDYLQEAVISPEKVKFIIATHWHDDHVKGLSQVLKECSQSKFVISNALSSNEFLTLLGKHDLISSHNSGIKEFSEMFEYLSDKGVKPILVSQDQIIHRNQINEIGVEIVALSPSNSSIIDALHFFNSLPINGSNKNVVKPKLNHLSIVVQMKVNDLTCLFGADLENHPDTEKGWTAVLGSETFSVKTSNVFKVPHHGSKNASSNELWASLSNSNIISMLTPWRRGNRFIPTNDEAREILTHSDQAYITSNPKEVVKKKRDYKITKKLRRLGIDPKSLEKKHGRVILKFENNNYTTTLEGSASELLSIYDN